MTPLLGAHILIKGDTEYKSEKANCASYEIVRSAVK